MKKIHAFIVAFTLVAGLLCSCHMNKVAGNGNIVSREILISDYDELQMRGENLDIQYRQSDEAPYLKIETDQNILDILDITSNNNELAIQPKDKHIGIAPTRLTVITNSTALKELKIAGGGNCDLGKGIHGEKLEIKFAGGIDIKADSIDLTRLEYEMAGSSTLALSGKTEKMHFKGAGSSRIEAFDLKTEEFSCEIAGSTYIEITANKALSTQIAGSGTVRYKGNPSIQKKKIAGSGSITKVD